MPEEAKEYGSNQTESPGPSQIRVLEIVRTVREFQTKASPTYTVWEACVRILNGEKAAVTNPSQINYTVALPFNGDMNSQAMFNKLLEPFRTLLAKLSINIPYAGAMPATDSPDDVAKAQAAESLLAYWLQQQHFDKKMTDALGWLLETGNVGLYLCQYGKETRLEVINPYNFFYEADCSSPDITQWVVVRRYATRRELLELFPSSEKEIKSEAVAGASQAFESNTATGYSNSHPSDRIEYWEYTSKDSEFMYILPGCNHVMYASTLPDSCWPFFHLRYTPVSGRLWGKGVIEPSIEPQRFYNLIRTAMLRNATLTGNPKVLIHNSDAQAAAGITDRPGQILLWGGDADISTPPPSYMIPPSIPAYVQNLPSEMAAEIMDAMGIHATSLGKRQANVSSGVAIQALTENDASQLAVTMQQIEFCVQHISRCALMMMKAYMPEKTMIRQLDRWGASVFRELKMTDLGEETPEIFIDADSLFRTRAADRRAQIMADMQMGLLTPEEAKEKLRSRTASMPDLSYMADLRHAKEVLETVIAIGAPVQFYKRDNLPLLERVFGEYIRSPAYYKLSPSKQELLSNQYDTIIALQAPTPPPGTGVPTPLGAQALEANNPDPAQMEAETVVDQMDAQSEVI